MHAGASAPGATPQPTPNPMADDDECSTATAALTSPDLDLTPAVPAACPDVPRRGPIGHPKCCAQPAGTIQRKPRLTCGFGWARWNRTIDLQQYQCCRSGSPHALGMGLAAGYIQVCGIVAPVGRIPGAYWHGLGRNINDSTNLARYLYANNLLGNVRSSSAPVILFTAHGAAGPP